LLADYADRLAIRHFAWDYDAGAEPDRHPSRLCVVIPALNEQGALPDVLSEVPKEVEGLPVEVIVVSDGSTDATERVARDFGALVVGRDLRRGQGAAVALGYRIAVSRGATVVATLDADGQYDPLELPQLVKPILAGDADVVHGSRMLGDYERPLFGRSQGVKVFAWLTSFMAKHPITDPASGFRAFRADSLEQLEFRERQFHASEVTIAAAKKGLRVREVPCTFRERVHGSTKKPPLLQYGWGYARSLLRTWLG
jgi:glycosyltransferase involved in cell wall biosynthesis